MSDDIDEIKKDFETEMDKFLKALEKIQKYKELLKEKTEEFDKIIIAPLLEMADTIRPIIEKSHYILDTFLEAKEIVAKSKELTGEKAEDISI